MSTDPLYEIIASAAVNGELPADFSLPGPAGNEGGIKWADGALDGVTLYHSAPPEISDDDRMLISDAVRAAGKRDDELADALFEMLGRHHRAIALIDEIQSYVIENKNSLSADDLYGYAIHLLFESEDIESVKFGLSLLELFVTDKSGNLKKAVRTFGLSDEFALFAIFIMQHWESGNSEIWELAKKVHGWGRIHAVEYLKPDSEEIRTWLLMEGVHNDVMPAYSALTCWEKSGAEDILRNDPSKEEIIAIGDIIAGLIDEGPVVGISAIPNSEEILALYLETAAGMDLTPDNNEVIEEIYSFCH